MGSETTVGEPVTAVLRRDIERTERQMSDTIDEIHDRLSPRNVMNRTKESVRRTTVNTSHTFITKVKENPIPAAMVGVGLWLLLRNHEDGDGRVREIGDRNFASYDFDEEPSTMDKAKTKVAHAMGTAREKVSDMGESTRETVSDVADAAKEKAGQIAESTRETVSHMADVTRDKARAMRQQTRDVMRDSPLVAGIAALALGAIIAAVIPETDKEDELLGETRDRMLDQAKDAASEGVDKARRMVSVATDAVTDQVRSNTAETTAATPQFR